MPTIHLQFGHEGAELGLEFTYRQYACGHGNYPFSFAFSENKYRGRLMCLPAGEHTPRRSAHGTRMADSPQGGQVRPYSEIVLNLV